METLKAIIQYKLPIHEHDKENLYSVSVGGGTGQGGGQCLQGKRDGPLKEVGGEQRGGQDLKGTVRQVRKERRRGLTRAVSRSLRGFFWGLRGGA